MNADIRPRRSVLYMPGSNSRALDKARELPADCLILDLEDAVDPNKKVTARNQIVAALDKGGYGDREIVVRVNALSTAWGPEDMHAVAKTDANAILLPKVESLADIEAADDLLSAAGSTQLPIWVMAETPRGILNLAHCANHPRVAVIVMGTSDLAKALRVSALENRAGLSYALSAAVLAARAHGLDIIDGVHLALDDTEGFRAACRQGRALGFDGKSLIHPRQIATANEIFGISQSAANHAKEIIVAWQQASAENKGVTVVRGQLVEQLHVDEAERVLQLFSQTAGGSERN